MKMTSKNLLCGLLAVSIFSAVAAASKSGKHDTAAPVPVQHAMTEDEMRVEGEKRFPVL